MVMWSVNCICQTNYWQQQVDYRINVELIDSLHSLNGTCTFDYHNNAPDTLTYIWIHLWPNAYKNDKTAFSDQLLKNGRTYFYFADDKNRGYINRLKFTVNNENAQITDDAAHQDFVKLLLPKPLFPGQTVTVSTPFYVKLPAIYSRAGFANGGYQITQWYPKPAVYDRKGWHPMPYLDQGEFYSEFGNFNVRITAPDAFVIAASGKEIAKQITDNKQTLSFELMNAHDFAWFAHKDFLIKKDSITLHGETVQLLNYYLPAHADAWKNSMAFTKNAVESKSNLIGNYPYSVLTVVDDVGNNPGGMEYPTITVLSASGDEKNLEHLIFHEVGHNWFYGILASNERAFPWMDEGMNTYYDGKMKTVLADTTDAASKSFFQRKMPQNAAALLLGSILKLKTDQTIDGDASAFSSINYGLIAYEKAAQWMNALEKKVGATTFENIMKAYFAEWKFKHPYPEDFKAVAEQISKTDLTSHFNLLQRNGYLTTPERKKIKPTFLFNLSNTDKFHYLSILPAAGYNFYDWLMIGAAIHNYNIPASDIRLIAIPFYATGSKTVTGIGNLNITAYRRSNGEKLSLGAGFAKFTADNFKDSTGKINNQEVFKFSPMVNYTFSKSNPLSTLNKQLSFKTFFITETGIRFKRDTVLQQDVITYPKQFSYINQLQFLIENTRVLYPYQLILQAQQGKGFARTTATANYFFNYAKGGGVNVRAFAGKFYYTKEKTNLSPFETDRYQLNLTGAKGNEDYTYSNYFYGRNEFDGLGTQQIMIRDGGFKVRTDLLSNKIGKTDNWLGALNITTSIPNSINPLSLLPVKLPLQLFADLGTTSQIFNNKDGGSRFLFDAGLQFSVLKNVLQIYVPLLYSKVYSNYFKSTISNNRLLKNISFSIDVERLQIKKRVPQLDL